MHSIVNSICCHLQVVGISTSVRANSRKHSHLSTAAVDLTLTWLRSQFPSFFPSLRYFSSPAVSKPISFAYISRAFRPLQICDGFEMLLCADNSRTRLQVVKYGSCNTDELRCLGMGRVYIRPIQVDITLGDIEDDDEHAEECLLCRESIPLRGMRAHMETCRVCVLLVTFF